MNQCLPQMLFKALGTRPLDSVFLVQRLLSTSDRLRALWIVPVS
jgi:hypothetical protein